jgi:surface carbohydrate biosynthesis protein (TIGR04326 family)
MKFIVAKEDDKYMPSPNEVLVLWSSYRTGDRIISLPRVIEQNADQLKIIYLERLNSISSTALEGFKVSDYLEIPNKFNYWSATSLMQKFNAGENSEILVVIKLIAFNEYILKKYNKVNQTIIIDKSLSKYFKKNQHNKFLIKSTILYKKYIYLSISILYFIIKIFGRYLYFKSNKISILNLETKVIFFDVLAHLQPNKTGYSFGYWGVLEEKIIEWGIPVIWMHSYIKSPLAISYAKAMSILSDDINQKNKESQHYLTDSFINGRVLIQTLLLYIKLISLSNNFIKKALYSLNSFDELFINHQFHPMLKSLYGKEAIDFCYRYSLFEEIFGKLNKLKKVFFLYENQPWEHALLSAGNRIVSATNYGVAHSTIRPWDLRYFSLESFGNKLSNIAKSTPDVILVNSKNAKDQLRDGGFVSKNVIVVEALRYMYIDKIKKNYLKINEKYKVIVYCDYLKLTNQKIINWVEKFQNENTVSSSFEFSYKEHPAYKNLVNDRVKVIDYGVEKSMEIHDIAITSSLSSTAIESSEVGLKVLQVLDPDSFDFSLCRYSEFGISSARTYDEFKNFFLDISSKINYFNGKNNYFNSSIKLDKWCSVLND